MTKHRLQRLLAVGAVLSVFAAACGSSATEGSGGEGSGAATGVCAEIEAAVATKQPRRRNFCIRIAQYGTSTIDLPM